MGPYRQFRLGRLQRSSSYRGAQLKKLALAVCLVSAFFVVKALVSPTSAADEASDFNALVGKWVWHQSAKPFTVVLTITSVSTDGRMTGTYEHSGFSTPGPRPVKPSATVTNGQINVAFKFRTFGFDPNYLKRSDSLKGPVSGFKQEIREQNSSAKSKNDPEKEERKGPNREFRS
jgi:hypothetical protein